MATTIEQQVALDEALVPITKRLKIGRSNFRLPSDIQSKESSLQVVYDVLRRSPFFKAFLVTTDVPKIYMQEFWATAYVHQHFIRFKMDSRKNIVYLEAFRKMLHISPRVPGQSFDELPFEEEILDFLRFLGLSAQIKTLFDVNINKLFQPWRSFAAVINKFLTGKSSGFDRTMATTIEQQVALDEALVPSIKRLRIGRSNFRLPSDIQSKESTLQVVYDVLHRSPFFKAFLVTADVPEIYMQEFWATAYVHQHSIRFKMDSRKNIVYLKAFKEMLHISPRVPGQSFVELPFKEEILNFLRFLGHSAQIKTLSDVYVNKLFQSWRSFAAVINKCLTGKSFGFDSFRLSQAQILWGLYHKRNIDYAFLIWEDFVYQVEHNNQKKSDEMYYPRFTKVIIHHFMTKKPSIPRRNKVNWHYVRDDILFSTIKVVSRHQNTQQYGAILPIELTTEDIRNTKAYKEYYACAIGEAAPKPKASARRKKGGSDSSTTPPTAVASSRPITTVAAAPRLTAAAKGKQPAKAKSPYDPSVVERTEAE
nr:hypothetical protein [Tanacetum cinerariifolium]